VFYILIKSINAVRIYPHLGYWYRNVPGIEHCVLVLIDTEEEAAAAYNIATIKIRGATV